MTITSTRVHTATIVDGCDLRGISCMGSKRHLVRLDDNHPGAGAGIFTQRYILSTDDGMTFGEQPEQTAPFLPLGPMLSVSPNVLIGGFGAGHVDDPYGPFALISRSTDGGATWSAGISADLYSTLAEEDSDIFAFVRLDVSGEILAFGGATVAGSGLRYQVLRSLDSGASFALFAQVGTNPNSPLAVVNAAVYAGDGVVLAAGSFLGGASPTIPIWRSEDRGQNWVEVSLPTPGGFGSVACFASMGGGVVLAGGQVERLDNDLHVEAVVWRSTDFGQTWTAYILPEQPFHGGGGLQRYTVNALRPMTTSKVVAGVSIFGPPVSVKNWRLSTDGGATFPDTGVETSSVTGTASVVREITGADDGALLTGITKFNGIIEIWRSTVDGFNGPGPCASSFAGGEPPPGASPCSTPFRNRIGACVDTLTDDDIIRAKWQSGDRLVINRVIFSIDWDHLTQQFTKHVIYTFGPSVKKYGLRPAMRIESKGIRSAPTACNGSVQGCALSMLDERAFNLGARFADPPPMLNADIFYRKHTWEPSDIICVTSAFVPNTIAGRRGITNEAFEIVNIQQQFAPEGKIILTLLDVEAITLPEPPERFVVQNEAEMLARMREKDYRLTEVPPPLREIIRSRVLLSEKGRKPKKEPPPPDATPEYVHDPRGYFPGAP
jgi:hypothetical protein